MLFNTFVFFIFLGTVIPIFYALPRKHKAKFILLCSYFFYGYWDYRFVSLLLISTIVDFLVGAKLFTTSNKLKRKLLLYTSLFTNLGILGFFKYFNFFTDSFNSAFNYFGYSLDFLHMNIILPVGISFYTFQTLTYTIDIYRGKLTPTNSFIDFAVYVSFFPQLVAGPIERAKNLLPQIKEFARPNAHMIQSGIVLISVGLFRKVLIGDTSGRIVDQIFAQPEYYSSLELIMGLVLFSFQIYNDFAGYSNIARGTAKLLGINIMVNFNQPYLSANITEFWRRWHISLSSWLKDYLYISLGGNRKGKYRTYMNLMLTMLLGGLWHGANWTFVVWGGLHGIYLSVHKMFLRGKKIPDRYEGKFLSKKTTVFLSKIILTYLLVLLTWLFFRAENFSHAFTYFTNIFAWSASAFPFRALSIILAFSMVSFFVDFFEYYFREHTYLLRVKTVYRYALLVVVLFYCFVYMFQAEPMPFIYFQF